FEINSPSRSTSGKLAVTLTLEINRPFSMASMIPCVAPGPNPKPSALTISLLQLSTTDILVRRSARDKINLRLWHFGRPVSSRHSKRLLATPTEVQQNLVYLFAKRSRTEEDPLPRDEATTSSSRA